MIVKKIISPGLCFFVVCLFVIMSYGSLCAKNQKPLEILIAEKLDFKLKNPGRAVDTNVIFSNYDGDSVIAQAKNLITDPNESVKNFGYQLLTDAGRFYKKPEITKQAVNFLVKGMADKNRSRALELSTKLLKLYKKTDFSKEAKAELKQRFDEVAREGSCEENYTRNVILLIGVADMKSEMGRLQEIVARVKEPLKPLHHSSDTSHKNAFVALMAIARMGDDKAVDRCISIVDSEIDEFRKVSVLLKSIEYIRQPEAVEYIKQFLYSDKMDPYKGEDVVGSSYATRAAEYMEKMIVGFPTWREAEQVHREKWGTDLEFRKKWRSARDYYPEYCRQWLESQTSIEIIR